MSDENEIESTALAPEARGNVSAATAAAAAEPEGGFPPPAVPVGPPVTAPPTRRGLPAWAWWLIGGGIFVVVAIVAVIALVVALALGAASRLATSPDIPITVTTSTASPGGPGDSLDSIPSEITFEAGISLPPHLLPGFSSTLLMDPDWQADPSDTNLFDGTATYTHLATGCTLFTYQTYATDIVFDPSDDYANSIAVLKSFYVTDEIGQPGTYLFPANLGASQLEVAAVFATLESGAGQLTTARGFGVSNIALITAFTCADASKTTDLFVELGMPTIAVEFMPE